jgi:hypothetical protein
VLNIEEGPEEGEEEHHLGGDEQHHAHAQPVAHGVGVVDTAFGLGDHVLPPAEHCVEHQHEAGQEPVNRPFVHVPDAAGRHDERGNRADERPLARVQQVVGMGSFRASHQCSPFDGKIV